MWIESAEGSTTSLSAIVCQLRRCLQDVFFQSCSWIIERAIVHKIKLIVIIRPNFQVWMAISKSVNAIKLPAPRCQRLLSGNHQGCNYSCEKVKPLLAIGQSPTNFMRCAFKVIANFPVFRGINAGENSQRGCIHSRLKCCNRPFLKALPILVQLALLLREQ